MKKRMRRILAVTLALAMVFTWIPAGSAKAADSNIYFDEDNQSEELALEDFAGIGQEKKIDSVYFYYDETAYQTTFQWYEKSGSTYHVIEGATNEDYTIAKVAEEDYTYFRQDITLWNGTTKVEEHSCYYLLDNNYALDNSDQMSRYVFYDEGNYPVLKSPFTHNADGKGKISYQWYTYGYSDEDFVETKIEGGDTEDYAVTAEVADTAVAFYCVAKVQDIPFQLYSTYIQLFKSDRVVNLSDKGYTTDITAAANSNYVQHIIGADATKSMTIHFDGTIDDCLIQDMDGNNFYLSQEDGAMNEFTLKGNECYLLTSINKANQAGISSVTENDTFIRTVYELSVKNDPQKQWYNYGDKLDLTGLVMMRTYNDGTVEDVPLSELSYDENQTLKMGSNQIKVTDSVSGMWGSVYIYVDSSIEVNWVEKPDSYYFAGQKMKASVQVKSSPGTVNFLWMLRDEDGNLVTELDNDTTSEVTLPETLPKGNYSLECYYYLEGEEFEPYSYVSTDLTVLGEDTFMQCEDYPESTHTFSKRDNLYLKGFRYRVPGADYIDVTFDEKTKLDERDQIVLYTNDHKGVTYKDNELSGKTVTLKGDTAWILISMQPYSTGWGFRVTNIEGKNYPVQPTATPPSVNPTPKPTVKPSPSAEPKTTALKSSIVSLKSKVKKTAALKVKKTSKAAGYQIAYARDVKFKKNVKTVLTKKTSITVKKLKSHKVYYWRVRAYALNSKGKKVYGAWSKSKKLKIK